MVDPGKSRARRGGSARPLTGTTPRVAEPGTVPGDFDQTRQYTPVPAPSQPTSASHGVSTKPDGSARRLDDATAQPVASASNTTSIMPAIRPDASAPHQETSARQTSAPTAGAIAPTPPARKPRKKKSVPKRILAVLVILVVITLGWLVGLGFWANGQLQRQDVLSGAASTPGTTYLLAGSDSRAGDVLPGDTTPGQRADTIIMVNVAPNGHATLVSLPRDTLVEIPGRGTNKLNAAYAFGGSKLLISTVEGLTGLTVDHYVEIGFSGVENIVDAIGTVNVCLDQDVNDPASGLNLKAGCSDVDGKTALAFVRVRHFDPTADLGRQKRQQDFIKSLSKSVLEPATFINPLQQYSLAKAATQSITVDDGTNIVELGKLGMAFRAATGPNGTVGKIPWINPNYSSRVGSAIQIDPAAVRQYFATIADGTIAPGKSE